MEIIPTILTDNPLDLEKKIRQVETFFDKAQIDFMDGKFVPTRSISPGDLAKVKTTLKLNAHLMVYNPDKYIESLKEARVEEIIFHIEAVSDPFKAIEKIRKSGLKTIVALNPETPLSKIFPVLREVSSVLFLSVNPGRYGSLFIPGVLEKVREFKREKPQITIGLDGGVKLDNINQVKAAPVDTVYVGSGIFGTGDPQKNFQALKTKVAP